MSRFIASALFLTLSTSAWAGSETVTTAEFLNTSSTLESGTILIHPFLPSSYAVNDTVQLNTAILGWIGGPNLSAKIGLADNFAVTPSVSASWNFQSINGGLAAHYSIPMGENGLHLNAGFNAGNYATISGDGTSVEYNFGYSVPVTASFHLVASDTTRYRFYGSTEVLSIANGFPFAVVGANWNHGFGDVVRLSLGLGLFINNNPLSDLPVELAFLNSPVLPFPTFEIWFRI